MNKGKQVFTASILAAVLVVSIAVLSVPEAEGLHPIDIVGAIGPGELALDLLVPLTGNRALETTAGGEIEASLVTDTELALLDDRTGTLLTTNQANTITALQTLDVTEGIQINDQDGTPVADRRLSVIDGLFVARSTGDAEGRHISRASLELIENSEIAAGALIAFSKLAILTEGNILIGGGGGVVTSVDPTGIGDIEASTGSGLVIKDLAVTTGKIAANDVTSAKLADAIELPTSLKVGASGVTIKAILSGTEATPAVGFDTVTVTGAASGDVAFCSFSLDGDDVESVEVGEITTDTVQVLITDDAAGPDNMAALHCIVFDIT